MFTETNQNTAGFAKPGPKRVRMDRGVKLGFEPAMETLPAEVRVSVLVARAEQDADVDKALRDIAELAESPITFEALTWTDGHLAVVLAAAATRTGKQPTQAATQPAARPTRVHGRR